MSSSKPSIPKLIETAKFTFLGIYFFAEFVTITEIMGLTKHPAGPWIVVESNRMWFYALVLSILQAVWEGLFVVEEDKQQRLVAEKEAKTGKGGKKASAQKVVVSDGPKTKGLPYKQLLSDGLDLLIPGAVIQVIPFSPLVVGIAMFTSTVLQLSDMWPKVQAEAAMAAARKK